MPAWKRPSTLALAAAVVAVSLVLLVTRGAAAAAGTVAAAVVLLGMFLLRRHARAALVYRERTADADEAEPRARSQRRRIDDPPRRDTVGTLRGPFY